MKSDFFSLRIVRTGLYAVLENHWGDEACRFRQFVQRYYYGIQDPRIMKEGAEPNKDKHLDDVTLSYLEMLRRALRR